MNMLERTMGIYGKLPAHGDFIERNVPRRFLDIWDDWLQRCLANSQDAAGEEWLESYLTSPVWYFSLGHGVIDANPWIGIIVPSVDAVGRYFPLSIIVRLEPDDDPHFTLVNNSQYFDELADDVINAMQHGLTIEELWPSLQRKENQHFESAKLASRHLSHSNATLCQIEASDPQQSLAILSYAHTRLAHPCSSLWYCKPSAGVPSTCITLPGLPPADYFWPMISHHWDEL